MKSVADRLRRQTVASVLRLSAANRIDLALRLGDEDAARLAAARGISEAEARRLIRASRQIGRSRSSAAEP
jgi:hypothetical protein